MCVLRNVYFSGKEMLPNFSTEALNDLCLIQGVGDLSALLSDKHISYQGDKSIGEFQQAVAEVIEEGILSRAQSANCFSILVDQSHSFPEQSLLLYVRIIEQVAGGYEPKTYFLALKQMGEATAGKIMAEIAEMLKGKGLDVTKMCGVAIDGVSITTENKHEVVTQLKARVPGILSIHCIAHRLALSSVSAADTVPYLVKYQHVLASVYKYFANVLASREGLEAMLKILRDSEKQSSPFKETSSRWLTVRASIEAVIRNFGCLVSVLRSDGSAIAIGLAKSMCTYKFLHCSHFLADILHQLYILCKSYHTARVDFSIAHSLLKSTVTTINKLSGESSGEMLKTFLATLPAGGWDDNAGFFSFQSHQIKGGGAQRRAAESICRMFARNLTDDLKARFSEPGDAATITAMTAIFDPAYAPDSKSQHIQTVTNYLSSLSSESDKEDFEMSCKQELVSFMNFVESQPGVNALTSAKDVCELALKQKLMFPTVSSLAERFLALPITTAELERGFSREAALQSRLGNSLSGTSLENLLKISIHGPPIKEFSFRNAYLKWVSSKLDKTLKPKS
uniref:HAT C-terminal dimerisation domain-containing protein n=1 Tax=Callorhinchus milii TaxID=7868 RepID=A0A4W3J6H6_CALMI